MNGGICRRFLRRAAVGMALVAAGAPTGLQADDSAPARSSTDSLGEYPTATLPTSAGGQLSLTEARGRVATVIVSMSVECPISGEYLPTIQRVADDYAKRGVKLIGIDPNAGETLELMADYARQRKLTIPFAKDTDAKISRRLLFNVTPEVCVFDASGKIVYRGRIDDRYRAGGGRPGAKITSDLALALDEVLAGQPVSHARTRPVGCPIQLSAPSAGDE